jgi:hypothetical protein
MKKLTIDISFSDPHIGQKDEIHWNPGILGAQKETLQVSEPERCREWGFHHR